MAEATSVVSAEGGAVQKEVTAVSWTGGKDCNLSLLCAKREPTLDVRYLICFRPEDHAFRAHPIPMMQEQARCIGLPLLFVDIPRDTTDYMKEYVDGLRRVRDEYGIKVICTGDMDLMDRALCLNTLLSEGFDIVFTCVKSPFFDGSWINRILDEDAIEEMKAIADQGAKEGMEKPLDLGGERGEYHTMCVNGPIYKERVGMDINDEPCREDVKGGTHWKGNIHNADSIWTISLNEDSV
ncbi:hypothetical protein ACHAWF_018937 [Thalassiosira exigua]